MHFLFRQKFINILRYISICFAYIYIYIYTHKSITTTNEDRVKKNKKRDEEIGKQKLNEVGALNIK